MKRLLFGVAIFGAATSSFGALLATGDMTFTPNGSNFDYTITLHNTGTIAITTLWYAWLPREDFMATLPFNISSPTGWNPTVFGGGPIDGYSIQWFTNTPLAAGASLTGFKFTSASTPAQLSGNSPFFPTTPVGTSAVFDGTPELSDEFDFIITPTAAPEPATCAALGLGALAMVRRRRRRA